MSPSRDHELVTQDNPQTSYTQSSLIFILFGSYTLEFKLNGLSEK